MRIIVCKENKFMVLNLNKFAQETGISNLADAIKQIRENFGECIIRPFPINKGAA